jgi:hypothetical protein
MTRGAGATEGGAASGFGGASAVAWAAGATGAAAGLASIGADGAGRGGAAGAAGACLLMMAFSTSPGLEMWERSILVLISSPSARLGRGDLLACASEEARMCPRTLSASWSSRELEWVFFSVIPTFGSVSRISLLLTSSSLARSLIRILLIRRLFPPDCSR